MKISELPEDVQKKALEYQKEQGDFNCEKSDYLAAAFDWEKTNEGYDFWNEWRLKKYMFTETITIPSSKINTTKMELQSQSNTKSVSIPLSELRQT